MSQTLNSRASKIGRVFCVGIAVVVVVLVCAAASLRAVEFVSSSLNLNLVTRRLPSWHVVVQP